MGFWKKIRVMILIGLGIFTISSSGQVKTKTNRGQKKSQTDFELFSNRGVLEGLARTIENEIEDVSRVSNISINQFSYHGEGIEMMIHFTVETTNGDVFEDFQCRLLVSPYEKTTLKNIELLQCGNSVAKFNKQISFPMGRVFEFYKNDTRRGLE